MKRSVALGIVFLVLSACTVGPDYVKPKPSLPPQWSELQEAQATAAVADLGRWWTLFHDPVLDRLIGQALESNQELRIAESRILEARAQRGVVAADGYPNINANAAYSRFQDSSNQTTSRHDSEDGSTSTSKTPARDLFTVGFDASWEIDIFGGVRRGVEAADADISAARENKRDVLVSLLAEVARSYIQVRSDQRRIAIAQENIAAQRKTVELTEARFEAGLSTELDVAQAKAQLATTEAGVPLLESSSRQAMHQLAILLGEEPGALLETLSERGPIPVGPDGAPIGLPSDLLKRRPDIRRAERELAAATARIGEAKADLFPKFALIGALGYQSMDIRDLAHPSSRLWSYGPSVRWPVFDAGRIRARVAVQDARQQQALIRYEQTILSALKDVEDALVAHAKERSSRESRIVAEQANEKAYQIASELYAQGLKDFLNVLITQLALYSAQDALAQSDQAVATFMVSLFKALGGGWDPDGGFPEPQPVDSPEGTTSETENGPF
ncbi:MAG: efflux transporter outer membrane subunit [Syntrophobacteraceae bacterium]